MLREISANVLFKYYFLINFRVKCNITLFSMIALDDNGPNSRVCEIRVSFNFSVFTKLATTRLRRNINRNRQFYMYGSIYNFNNDEFEPVQFFILIIFFL